MSERMLDKRARQRRASLGASNLATSVASTPVANAFKPANHNQQHNSIALLLLTNTNLQDSQASSSSPLAVNIMQRLAPTRKDDMSCEQYETRANMHIHNETRETIQLINSRAPFTYNLQKHIYLRPDKLKEDEERHKHKAEASCLRPGLQCSSASGLGRARGKSSSGVRHSRKHQRPVSSSLGGFLQLIKSPLLFAVLVTCVAGRNGSGSETLAQRNREQPASYVAYSSSSSSSSSLSPSLSVLAETDKQLQLLRSANVELSRRSQRLQRDTPADLANSNSQQQATVRPTCGYPGSPAHASVTFNTSHVVAGTAASYTCDNGYELLGPPRRICQPNGTWSPVGIPFCVLNVGLGKAAMQSSTAGHGSAQKAVDGSTSPYFQASTCTMTDVEHNPWWYVNLLEPYLVQIVRIDFGTACCGNRQKATIAVRVGNNRPDLGNNPLCNRYHGVIEEGKPLFLPCTRPAPGAFVSIHLESPSGSSLSICETFIYTDHALSIEQCPSFRDQALGSTATYNGKCYLFHNTQQLKFEEARKFCESRGGTLVDETSPALQGFLSWELYRRHRNDQMMGQYWLGATRDPRNGQNWKWINGKDVQISFWNSQAAQGNCSRFDGSKGWLWSDSDCNLALNFICQYRPLSCGKPEKPTNSTLITKNIDNGTVIEYQCAPGNLLMGPKSRNCLPTGFFSEFAPKCKYLDCQFPAMIQNGDYKLLNGSTHYQSVVNYFCNEGYQIYGKATLTCDVDERWNGPPPRCEPLLCSAPMPPSNGYVTVTTNITIPGTQATFDCRPGYEIVGDRLLTCSQSGSWDNSFPYCREKRSHSGVMSAAVTTAAPVAVQVQATNINSRPNAPVAVTVSPVAPPPPTPATGASGAKPTGGNVQFPSANAPFAFSSSRIGATSSTIAPPTTPSNAQSLPASLNGLAGQFMQSNINQLAAVSTPRPQADNSLGSMSVESNSFQLNRKPANSNNVNQFMLPPPPPSPSLPDIVAPSQQQPSLSAISTQSPITTPQVSRTRPVSGTSTQESFATTLGSVAAASGSRQQQQQQQQQQATAMTTSNRSPGFIGQQQAGQTGTSGLHHISYDSNPVATTNSISVHSSNQAASAAAAANPMLTNAPVGSTTTTTSSTTTMSSASSSAHPHPHHQSHQSHGINGHNQQQQHHNNAIPNVLSSFSPPVRSHNTLASAKYSLDGIIAVAIFGGFIFLGAIITIIVIIIRRRKSSHSSTIDAQTISTYDSNGEHNGLYRNYQQAWENLRFATPSSQPKSSGNADVSLITAHVNGGPSVGLKNFAAPAILHHAHPHMHHAHHQIGHHNMAMSGSTTSSQSSSLGGGGVGGIVGAGVSGPGGLDGSGADPLLRAHHSHHHHHHSRHRHHNENDDDDDDDGEQGVLSSDEANCYRAGEQQQEAGEGFRDSNELTINADTVVNRIPSQSQAARRRLYSGTGNTNSSGATPADNRLSSSLSMGGVEQHVGHRHPHQHQHQHHQHHHHHSHHHLGSSAGSSQHQRLVSSSTPSTSTRSSRASPPSDDQSLEQLAYGNGWRANAGQHTAASQQDSSSNNHSAGSGASILGGARANLRYN